MLSTDHPLPGSGKVLLKPPAIPGHALDPSGLRRGATARSGLARTELGASAAVNILRGPVYEFKAYYREFAGIQRTNRFPGARGFG